MRRGYPKVLSDNAFVSTDAVPYLEYKLDRCFVKSWSTSGDACDRPTESLAVDPSDPSAEVDGLQPQLTTEPTAPGSTITFKVDGADVGSSAGMYIGMPIYGNPNIPDGGHDADDGLLLPAVQDDGLLLPAVQTDDGGATIPDGTSNTVMVGEVVHTNDVAIYNCFEVVNTTSLDGFWL